MNNRFGGWLVQIQLPVFANSPIADNAGGWRRVGLLRFGSEQAGVAGPLYPVRQFLHRVSAVGSSSKELIDMASFNTRVKPVLPPQGGVPPQVFEPSNTLRTHEGAPAARISPELALRRSVCSCLLWENTFYEGGQDIAARIMELATQVPPKVVADLAIDTRSSFNLRHVPLLLCSVLARTGAGSRLVSETIAATIQRPDELSEFLAIYAKANGVAPSAVKKKLSAQVKKGLAAAFNNFDRYQLAKYFSQSGEKGAVVRGRDVLFLTHAKPKDEEQAELFRRIAAKEAVAEGGADTWEAALSSGQDKGETFTRLLSEQKLGYLAVLRNLRNMMEAGVDHALVQKAILERRGARRVLPFRYVAAARACPQLEPAIDQALSEAIADMPALPGKTVVLVDVSRSMSHRLSGKSDLTRMDAAAALASVINGDLRVFTFSDGIVEVPPRRGMGGVQAVIQSQPHAGTYLGKAVQAINAGVPEMDRLIVITDEQAHDHVGASKARFAYLINVASAKNGVGYGERWTHIDGFSERVLRFIPEYENIGNLATWT